MYVEHLFEGKVLTTENIELKEEIYGNLVARYEDYLANGLTEAEALARTKASITSIDDVMAGESGKSEDEAPTTVISAAEPTVTPATAVRTPVPPGASESAGSSASAPKAKPKWPLVLGIVVVALVAIFGLFEFVIEPMMDRQEDIAETQAGQQWREQQSQNSGNDASSNTGTATTTDGGNGAATQNNQDITPTFSDPEDQAEYEATMGLSNMIQASTAEALRTYVGGTLDTQTVATMLSSMPLGTFPMTVGYDNAASVTIEYTDVDHNIEGDMIDNAIAYNVTSLMAVYPQLQSVTFTVNENDDHELEYDHYVVDRSSLESLLARTSSNEITQVNESLLESEDSWNRVRNYVATERFSDALMEIAERG